MDLYPYSQRQNGRVSDAEHERLWQGVGDGLLPGEASTALAVDVSGGSWSVQPGRILIAGHVLSIDSVQSGSVPDPAGSSRMCLVVANIDHAASPWTYGVELVLGTPGAGRPSVSRSSAGKYQVPLRAFAVLASGEVSVWWDERPQLDRFAGLRLPAVAEREESNNFVLSSDQWQYNGNPRCSANFIAPPSGEVMITVYARTATDDDTAAVLVSWELRRDGSQGRVVRGPRHDDGLTNRAASAASSTTTYVSGLEPYRQYYITTMHRMTNPSTTGDIRHRRLIIVPIR